jgi:hypothetical protein
MVLDTNKGRDVLEAFLHDVVYPTLPILPYDGIAAVTANVADFSAFKGFVVHDWVADRR